MSTKFGFRMLVALALVPAIGSAAPCIPVYGLTTITWPGTYCLARDIFSPNGTGIVIRTDNVVLDFAGHKLSTPSNPSATVITTGVDGSLNRNITVRNGTIRGFIDGINLGERVPTNNFGNFVVTNMRIDQAISDQARAIGIFIEGANFTITNNTITNVKGIDALGMLLHGNGPAILAPGKIVITGNRIDRVSGIFGDGTGIALDGGAMTRVDDNVVTEIAPGSTPSQGVLGSFGMRIGSFEPNSLTEVGGNVVRNSVFRINSVGIYVNTHGDQIAFVRDSQISGMSLGLDLGGSCVSYFLYNTISGATTPYRLTGDQVPCSRTDVGAGPGNNPPGP